MKTAADDILALNQDAMVIKSTRLRRRSEWVETLVVVGVLAALVLGLLASAALTSRALRPIAVLGQSVRRLGQGDYAVRVRIPEGGGSEIAQLARDFNAMAEACSATATRASGSCWRRSWPRRRPSTACPTRSSSSMPRGR